MLEPALYRNLDLAAPFVCYRSDRAHRTLMERQDLLPYIRSYRGPLFTTTIHTRSRISRFIRWSRGKPSDEHIPWTETQNFKAAIIIFTKATNIRDLHFTDLVDWASDPDCEPVKMAVFKMKLTRLVLRVGEEWTNAIQVLQAQPELKHLALRWGTTELDKLEPTDVPKLRSLSATLRVAAAIVPGRPVQKLDLLDAVGDLILAQEPFSKLSQSLGPVSTFAISMLNEQDIENLLPILQMIAHHLPHIEDMTILVGGVVSAQEVCAFSCTCISTLRLMDTIFVGIGCNPVFPISPPAGPVVPGLGPRFKYYPRASRSPDKRQHIR